uniref:Uncharacterized protein n=1 Tax=viral metagenome TaxID=1070528 RepID=A0A6M3LSR2_9ZZZZ
MADTTTKMWGIGGRTITVAVTRAIAAAGDYTAEDVVSDSATAGTAITFDGICKGLGGAGYIKNASILCSQTGLTCGLRLYLYRVTPTAGALNDNVANTSVHTTDRPNYVGYINFVAMSDKGGNSETISTPSTTTSGLPLAFNCASGDDALYGILVALDAETAETAGMTMVISLTSEIQ